MFKLLINNFIKHIMFNSDSKFSRVYQAPVCDSRDYDVEGCLCQSGRPGEDFGGGNTIEYEDTF